jgi:hypothetical protein
LQGCQVYLWEISIIVGCGLGSATRRGPAGLFSAPRGSD